jgi:agmatinase
MAWDNERLAALRAKYSDEKGGEIFDPRFRKVADRIFDKSGTRAAPYAGVPTFLSAPYRQIDQANPDFGGLQVAITGVPMDLGVTNRSGSRFGPRALRAIDRIGPYNHVLGCAPTHELAVADIGDVPFASRYRLEQSHADIERHIARIVDAGVLPLSVGGDHSMTHPILKAVGKNAPVGLIHIDAH